MKLLPFALVLTTLTAQARIGFNYDQCLEKYGQPVSELAGTKFEKAVGRKTLAFRAHGFNITATLEHGKVEAISYDKQLRDELGQNSPITKAEKSAILSVNLGKNKTHEASGAQENFVSLDGTKHASVHTVGKQIINISTDKFAKTSRRIEQLESDHLAENKF